MNKIERDTAFWMFFERLSGLGVRLSTVPISQPIWDTRYGWAKTRFSIDINEDLEVTLTDIRIVALREFPVAIFSLLYHTGTFYGLELTIIDDG